MTGSISRLEGRRAAFRSRGARVILAAAVLGLAGCAQEPPAQVVTDTFCITAKKRSWSVHDTPETIRDAEAWNLLVDRRCGYPGKAAT